MVSNSLKIGKHVWKCNNSYQNIGLPKWSYTLTKPSNRVYNIYNLDLEKKVSNNSYNGIHELVVVRLLS